MSSYVPGWTNTNQDHEISMGMSEYLREGGASGGIRGKIKHRAEDFHVHEIDMDGNIAHLTELLDKSVIAQSVQDLKLAETGANVIAPDFKIDDETRQKLQTTLLDQEIDAIEKFIQSIAPPAAATTTSTDDHNDKPEEKEKKEKKEEGEEKKNISSASTLSHASKKNQSCTTVSVCGLYPAASSACESVRKDVRGAVHSVVKSTFPFLVTDTRDAFEDDPIWAKLYPSDPELAQKQIKLSGCRLIVIRPTKKCLEHFAPTLKTNKTNKSKSNRRTSSSEGHRWPKEQPHFLKFTLFKFNRDTNDAMQMVARSVERQPKTFGYAGIKDRRAVTVQHFTGHKLPRGVLEKGLLHGKWDKNVRVQAKKEYVDEGLFLGDLKGNFFRIAVRGVPGDDTDKNKKLVEKLATKMNENGFINYFGAQRFGTGNTIRTYHIGAAFIKRDWEKALKLLLNDQNQIHQNNNNNQTATTQEAVLGECDFQAADSLKRVRYSDDASSSSRLSFDSPCDYAYLRRLLFEDRDYVTAQRILPRSRHLEHTLVSAFLHGKSTDARDILMRLPRNQRSLYGHSVQSLLWNLAVSHRIRSKGVSVCPGDVVVTVKNKKSCYYKLLTEEDDDMLSKYTLHDVVMPLPGIVDDDDDEGVFDFPEWLRDLYDSLCRDRLGLSFEDLVSTRDCGGSSPFPAALKAQMRHIVARAENVQGVYVSEESVRRCGGYLLATDVDRLEGRYKKVAEEVLSAGIEPPTSFPSDKLGTEQATNNNEEDEEDKDDGTYGLPGGAAVFTLSLPKSSYLTVALREILDPDP